MGEAGTCLIRKDGKGETERCQEGVRQPEREEGPAEKCIFPEQDRQAPNAPRTPALMRLAHRGRLWGHPFFETLPPVSVPEGSLLSLAPSLPPSNLERLSPAEIRGPTPPPMRMNFYLQGMRRRERRTWKMKTKRRKRRRESACLPRKPPRRRLLQTSRRGRPRPRVQRVGVEGPEGAKRHTKLAPEGPGGS